MLHDLKKLHDDLSVSIDDLERLTAVLSAPPPELATTRLKLTRASRRRSNFLEMCVYPALIREAAPDEAERVRQLRDTAKARLVSSADHIARWTLREIHEHWTDYRTASQLMRTGMRDRIREEQAILYPLLRN